jgi:hypothetical protein
MIPTVQLTLEQQIQIIADNQITELCLWEASKQVGSEEVLHQDKKYSVLNMINTKVQNNCLDETVQIFIYMHITI